MPATLFLIFHKSFRPTVTPLWMSCRCLGLNMPQTHHPTPPAMKPRAGWKAQDGLWLFLALILPVLLLSRFYWWRVFNISRYASFLRQPASSRPLSSLACSIRVTSHFQFYLESPYCNQSHCLKLILSHVIPLSKAYLFFRSTFNLCNMWHEARHHLSLVLSLHSFIQHAVDNLLYGRLC